MRPMSDKIIKFIDEVKEETFWLRRQKARQRVLELYRYARRLEKLINSIPVQ